MRIPLNLWLAILAALAIGLAALAIWQHGTHQSQQRTLGPRPLQGAESLSSAATIEMERGAERLQIERVDEAWHLPALNGYDANQDTVETWLDALAALRLLEPRTGNPSLFWELGLGSGTGTTADATIVRVRDASGAALIDLTVGDTAPNFVLPNEPGLYLRPANAERAWLAAGELAVDLDPEAWIDPNVVEIAPEDLRSITFAAADETPFIIRTTAEGPEVRVGEQIIAHSALEFGPLFAMFDPLQAAEVAPDLAVAQAEPDLTLYLLRKDRILIELERFTVGSDDISYASLRAFLSDRTGLDPYRVEALQDEVESLNAARGDWFFRLLTEDAAMIQNALRDLRLIARDAGRE